MTNTDKHILCLKSDTYIHTYNYTFVVEQGEHGSSHSKSCSLQYTDNRTWSSVGIPMHRQGFVIPAQLCVFIYVHKNNSVSQRDIFSTSYLSLKYSIPGLCEVMITEISEKLLWNSTSISIFESVILLSTFKRFL